MTKPNHKHKTVGVSFNPLVRKGASRRSRQLGLSFSRYVGLCVEAELAGQISDLRSAKASSHLVLADDHACEQTLDERLQLDVANLLREAGIGFSQHVSLGGMQLDFLILNPLKDSEKGKESEGGASAEANVGLNGLIKADAHNGIVIECCYPFGADCTALLGRAILLQQVSGIQAVLLCVPYLSVFTPEIHSAFARQGIALATPDSLLKALHRSLAVLAHK